VLSHDGFLEVREKDTIVKLPDVLRVISRKKTHNIIDDDSNLLFEKFHPYLNTELLRADALSSRLEILALKQMATDIIS
jgi:ATP-dependent helicase Lhr and Lhr-like helicase